MTPATLRARIAASETLLKLKMLWLYSGSFREWYRDIWLKDAGENICCNGHMCGCYGADYYSQWKYFWETRNERKKSS